MLHGDAAHSGYVETSLDPGHHVAWAVEFPGERLGTAMEPVLEEERVYVATHRGRLHALGAEDGKGLWRFEANGPFLHSPCVAKDRVVAGSVDGVLYGLEASSGDLKWLLDAGPGGVAASPVVAGDVVVMGTRGGDLLAVNLHSGEELWRSTVGVPIRQTAAVWQGKVFVTAEDMKVRCFQAATGELLWTGRQLEGQSARDYYPMVAEVEGVARVVVRTNPALGMAQRIARDRRILCENAGVDDGDWRKVDAWIKSEAAVGTPESWATEQEAIVRYLEAEADARTFFVLDAETGRETQTVPVLWVAGCQGVGAMPARTRDGPLLVFYRSAYGSWNHGVAPLVALGLLDLATNRIRPLDHGQGRQPPWNTFWGTADESQNFTVAGDTVLIVHQGTLSGFDLRSNRLFPIAGNRDTFGGFRNPAWARNEWHGPGRGAVAVKDGSLYWITGSRLLCLKPGDGPTAEARHVADGVARIQAPPPRQKNEATVRRQLREGVTELLSQTWAPLFVEPGLAGRDFSFDDSGEWLEALAWCYPHLAARQQEEVKRRAAERWRRHPPFGRDAWHELGEGTPRETFHVPSAYRSRSGSDKVPHPFGNMHAIWWYAERCDAWGQVLSEWPGIREAFDGFAGTGWKLDGGKGELYANRYLASLMAMARLAERAGDQERAETAGRMASETMTELEAWWRRVALQGTMTSFKDTTDLDPFIGKGDGLSFKVAPHRHKVALFRDLTPGIAARLRQRAPEAVARVWAMYESIYQTWHVVGEERQVHFGENFIDPPDLALGGFQAWVWLREATQEERMMKVDVPFCRADQYHLTKLAICLE